MATNTQPNVSAQMEQAMQTFRGYFDESFDEGEVQKIMEKDIKEGNKLEDAFKKHLKDKENVSDLDIKEAIWAVVGDEKARTISRSFKIETFTMEVGKSEVKILRNGTPLMNPIKLDSIMTTSLAKWIQIASMVVEIVLFILGAFGIEVPIDDAQLRGIIDSVLPLIQSEAYQRITAILLESWKQGSTWDKAKAVFEFLKATYKFGILWRLIKLVIASMSGFQRLLAMIKITAMLTVAFGSVGLALIAKIAYAIINLGKILEKVKNLQDLDEKFQRLQTATEK